MLQSSDRPSFLHMSFSAKPQLQKGLQAPTFSGRPHGFSCNSVALILDEKGAQILGLLLDLQELEDLLKAAAESGQPVCVELLLSRTHEESWGTALRGVRRKGLPEELCCKAQNRK